MGVALSVFNLVNIDKERLMRDVESTPQLTFADLELNDELGFAKSFLEFKEYNEDVEQIIYKAKHHSNTIKKQIRVFLDSIEEEIGPEETRTIDLGTKIAKEYQEIYYFDVIIDLAEKEIYIFTKQKVAKCFINRFKKSNIIDFESISFDLERVDEIPELANIWGMWEKSSGRCKKKAYFGTEVNKIDGIKKEKVTSYNVEFEHEDHIVDLFLAAECRISSKSNKVENRHLFEIFQVLKQGLSIKKKEEL